MALSPADFAAYSRATGTPYPEDPEERAALAPAVRDFRANQLRQPQEESPLAGILGAAALGLSALGAGALGYRSLRGRQPSAPVGKPRVPRESDLRAVSQAPLVRPSKVAGPETAIPQATVDLSRFEDDSDFLKQLELEEAEAYSATPEAQQEMRRATRAVQGVESKEKAFAKNALLQLRREQEAAAIPQATLDLTSLQQVQKPNVVDQFVEATDPGLDQAVQRTVTRPEQRDTDYAKFSRDATRITESNNRLRAAADQIWGFEEELERLGQQAQRYAAARQPTPFTAADLRGTLEEMPGFERSIIRGKQGMVDVPSALSTADKISIAEATYFENPKAQGPEAADNFLARTKANLLGQTTPQRLRPQEQVFEGGRRIGMSEEDIADRISAAANYKETDPRRTALLNPDVPTADVEGLMPSRLMVRGGRVGKNLTSEIQPGARASMVDVDNEMIPGYEGSDLEQAYNVTTGNVDSDYISEMGGYGTGRFSDYEQNAADYGDVEGPGGLIETRAYKERTNKGTTMVPGQTSEASGAATGSLRQEREIDTILPTRMTEEGDVARGFFIDPATGKLTLQGASRRVGDPLRGVLETEEMNVEGSKLVGGFEVPETTVSSTVSTQPVTGYRDKLVRGADGRLYEASGQEVVGEEPLLGFPRTKLTSPEGKTIGYTTLKNQKPVAMNLDRQQLQAIVEDGVDLYFNNPTSKRQFLAQNNPSLLQSGLAQNKTLSEIGGPLDFQNFLIDHLDKTLMNRGIDLPLLKLQVNSQTGTEYFTSAAHTFTTNLRKTTQESPVYGKPYQIDPETGRRVMARDPETGKVITNKGGFVQYVTEGEARPIPGVREVRGGGGIDPMTIGDEGADVDVAYYSPRINTAPLRETGLASIPSTQTGASMSALRSQMQTEPVGMRPRSPGSFSRTQNPYTGAAAAAMGPASRVLTGEYQYPERQLQVSLEPRSLSQGAERNQFELAANLTPGGQVVRGKQELGLGLGSVPGGIGQLSESETIRRYGLSGSQLQNFGNRLMSQAAAKRRIR